MIPSSSELVQEEQNSGAFEIRPTKTYKIDFENKRIIGTVDDKDAVMQFIRKVLSTDKYAFEIYDWYYGNELRKLIGQTYDYAVTRIPNIFREALLVDDRITNVHDFTFTKPTIDSILVVCFVDTIYGQIKYEQGVSI